MKAAGVNHGRGGNIFLGGVALERVTFRYREDCAPVLEELNIEANPGKFVALVKETERDIWMIEAKGREDLDDPPKRKRLTDRAGSIGAS